MKNYITITTYDELRQWAKDWVKHDYHCLMIFGQQGLGKSQTVHEILDKHKDVVPIKGRLTPPQLYYELKSNKDKLLFFDDTNKILQNGENVNLLMQVGEHDKTKTIQWNVLKKGGYASGLNEEEEAEAYRADKLRTQIKTSSRIMLLVNHLDTSRAELDPLYSRALTIMFKPTKEEFRKYLETWFPKDHDTKEIFTWIGKHLKLVPYSDVRDYTLAVTMKKSNRNWKKELLQMWGMNPDLVAATQVLNDPKFKTASPMIQFNEFHRLTGKPRSSFWALKKKVSL